MNDLTRINGIGPATARALAVAGIDSIPALAAADAATLGAHEAFRGLRASPGDLANWIAEARQIAPPAAPPDMNTPSGEDSAKADPADSAEPQHRPPEVPGATGAGEVDTTAPPPAPEPDAAMHVLSLDVDNGNLTGEVSEAANSPALSVGPPPAPAQDTPADTPSLNGFVLVVSGPKRGRRRAGMVFDATPRRIEAATLTPGQIEALRDDPALSVEVLPAAAD